LIEIQNLTKYYGNKQALDNISFTVNDGEILGFLGPNGAGKTTTMSIITGYLSSSEGTVTVNGTEIFDEPIKTKMKIGYLPEHPPLYLDMTVWEYMRFMYDLKKVKLPKKDHIDEICNLVSIVAGNNRRLKNLSKDTASVWDLPRPCSETRRCLSWMNQPAGLTRSKSSKFATSSEN
jgi:ABC-2 type transport system ATP-binding protein